MSIINLEKTFENEQLVYCNLDNKIIECICLSKLYKFNNVDYNNEYLGIFTCNKVKVITIYDIYKNLIYESIQTNLFKDSIKIGGILEDLKGCIWFFKIFIGAFIKNNKLNGIEYHINYKGTLYKFIYDNIESTTYNDKKIFNIYNNEGRCTHKIEYNKNLINYKNHNDLFEYCIKNNHIKITNGKFPFLQTIYCSIKNLKIFKIYKYHKNIEISIEKRNDNNEIIQLKYSKDVLKENFNSNNTNPPFSKPLEKFYIELIDYYKRNINNYNELTKSCLKKEIIYYNLLLNCKLEMINFK